VSNKWDILTVAFLPNPYVELTEKEEVERWSKQAKVAGHLGDMKRNWDGNKRAESVGDREELHHPK